MFFPVPDYMFNRFEEITPAFLTALGVRCLLCDIDNTLVTYDDVLPTESVLRWLSSLKEADILVILLSNNKHERVLRFAEGLDLAWVAKAGKPLIKKARKALKEAGIPPKRTAVLGDQLFTDVWVGKFLGAAATLTVSPIRDKKSLFVRGKRFLERPFIAFYKRREAKKQKFGQKSGHKEER